jgi:amino acid adenylation domain-containing protein
MPERLQDWVTHQADRRPEAAAVVGEGVILTYGLLEEQSNRLARILGEAGCARGDRVCLLMPKSPHAIAALLGIYKAGCIYVPLDPSSPPARLARILASCESRWILAGGTVAPLLEQLLAEKIGVPPSIGWIGAGTCRGETVTPRFTERDVARYPGAPVPGPHQTARDPAHILFTSGSTGTPKGVVITHANVIPFIEWAVRCFGLDASDRLSGHPPLHFDLSFLDIFGTFAAGAQLHLVPPQINLLPNKLAEFMRASELTQWFSVPSVLNYMAKFDVVRFGDFPTLKRLLWCGEVFPTPSLIHWMKRLPHARFTNLYGPTEATIASSYYTVPACPESERTAIPLGTACDGEELMVLDQALQPVPEGGVGELCIRGVGLSPGYWRDEEKTRAAFPSHPRIDGPSDRIYRTGDLARRGEDGSIYFVGRADSQVKSRGYRIELGEIEAGLGAVDSVRECAVVAIPTDGFEGTILCCAYAPTPGVGVTPVALRQALGRVLPSHMLPARWMALERLPRNANGKIDRASVREAFERDEARTARLA